MERRGRGELDRKKRGGEGGIGDKWCLDIYTQLPPIEEGKNNVGKGDETLVINTTTQVQQRQRKS